MFVEVLILLAAGPVISQTPLFQLKSPRDTHIKFSNDLRESEDRNVLGYEYFYNGGGVAVGDINNDGLEDVFFTSNMGENKLYLNLGHLQFKDITLEACKGLEGRKGGWKTGVTMADVNGDGLLDIYICYSGKVDSNIRRNQLFINQGDLKFKEEAKEYGLDDPGYGTQAVFFDYDNDGDLDMFLLNHNIIKVSNLELAKYKDLTDEMAGDKLFENQHGHFVDVSKKAGIHQDPLTFGLGVAIADVNQDGWQDIYVTNDYNEPDYLYINNHDGTFTEKSKDYFRHLSEFSMGVDIADFNNDGLPDVMTLDMLPESNRRQKLLQLQENYENFQIMQDQGLYKQYMRNMLELNNGDGTFSEIAQFAGVSNTDWSWCPLLADFDNDGYKDLFVSTGYLRDYTNKDFLRYWGDYKIKKQMDKEPELLMDLVKAMPVTIYPNYIFRNNHDLTFSNKQKEWGLMDSKISSGAVFADLDNDGDLDLLINNINQNAFVYQNMSREQHNSNYLSISLKGDGPNTHAIGAKAYLYNKGSVQYQEVNPNRGYLSCVTTKLHFGLAEQQQVDSVRIIWPDQTTQLLTNIKANQELKIAEDPHANSPWILKPVKNETVFVRAPDFVDYKNVAFTENDFKRQLLMLFMYSKTGPVVASGDINKDGLEDIFISGDKDKYGKIYVQQPGGKFSPLAIDIGDENSSAISAAVFFDANGDGFPDLYTAKGGYSLFQPNTPSLQDELFLNDGKGNFQLAQTALPNLSASSKSCVRPCDFDNDGDLDLFVGGRVIPGAYPVTPRSFLLVNDGKGTYHVSPTPFDSLGMVTDAQWVDLNNDGRKDLILCGEFMPVKIFINLPDGFTDKTKDYFEEGQQGFWNCISIADVDGDGQPDIIAGNLGLNSQIHVSEKEPGELYYADFDNNGSIDPFFNFYIQGKSYPFVSRDELNNQIYPMRLKFHSYKAYADATIKDIFSEKELAGASKLTVTESRTVCFLNRGGKFIKTILPVQAQFSMVTRILTGDFTGDGHADLLLLGNHMDNRLKIGSIDANYGCLLAGDGKGGFTYVPQPLSGLSIKGDVKSAEEIGIDGKKYILVGINDEKLEFYKEK
ncbi:MAG: VCBS repeat-containing protein [Bacteroidota bacterium]|nr:VCBS repeat-containing protein [Bacteroidota bacterium]MDP4248639.1 VCBS repeat-containing protein [Bacteroidota bacterium]